VASLIGGLVVSPPAASGEPVTVDLKNRSTNKWIPLGDGTFRLPEKGWPNLVGSRMLWIADRDCGLVAPLLTEYPKDYGVWTIRHKELAWEFTPSALPDGLRPDLWESPLGYVYLPGLKKVLVVRSLWRYSRTKAPVAGWLVDPQTAAWEPITVELSMADNSKDFNPSPGRDGLCMPIWGSAVYDATNREAVIFGGGGTWGRVGSERERAGPGDWIYDESGRRVRRLTGDDEPREARRWFPAHCGTWTFAEADKTWRAIAQPLGRQPGARILPSMAYDSGQQKIVLFGGDDLTRCLADTWVYDCKSRVWDKTSPKTSPAPRASATLDYVPDQEVLVLAGGYAGGWRPLGDVWAYSTKNNQWTRLGIDLPAPAGHASGDFDAKAACVTIAAYPATRHNKSIPALTLRLDMATVAKADPQPEDSRLAWHCKVKGATGSLLPDEWLAGERAPGDPAEGLKAIGALPDNTWVLRKPPYSPPARNWGSCVYDARTHRGYVWGGGHSTYPGADVIEYDLLTDRWRGMADPPNYNPVWLHGMSGGPPGVSFQGGSLLPTHSRKSYGIDVASNSLITYVGDVYSLKHRTFVANTGACPGKYDVATQVSFCSTPHGLYGYSSGLLVRVNVAEGKWEEVAKGGPRHEEHNHLCHDSKRDRLIYFVARKEPKVWVFDFRERTWTEETVVGRWLAVALGDSTYVPELDAAMLVFSTDPKTAESMYFYRLAEHRWYTAPYVGDKPAAVNTSGRDFSPIYDAKLKTVVRLQCVRGTQVLVMRLVPADLKLTPLE